ncbi:hypothetical protein E2C01_101386 [Portunus trituberculatus]|uniref:Uncharacterized protein n=1 Tax=Portunus trituberculatus TaxID=210409 RepID=A0A5B7KAL6_PORTR|nr:hypothetical protein [Portunus trituberculatus]
MRTLHLEVGWAGSSQILLRPHTVNLAASWNIDTVSLLYHRALKALSSVNPTVRYYSKTCSIPSIQAAAFCSINQARDLQREVSVTIRHYATASLPTLQVSQQRSHERQHNMVFVPQAP